MMKLSNFLIKLFSIFKNEDIKYCILRNYEELPEKNTGSDIDILISQQSLQSALAAIASIDEVRIISLNRRAYVVTTFLDKINVGEGKDSLQIDLVTGLSWKGMAYLSVNDVLDGSISHNTHPLIKKPSAHHEAIISFFSSYLIGGWIKERYQEQVRSVFGKHTDAVKKSLCPVLGAELSGFLIAAVLNEQRYELIALLGKVRYTLVKKSILSQPTKVLTNLIDHYVAEFLIRYTPQPLIQLCVLGVDGAGKSTMINGLISKLGSRVKEIEVIHLKPRFKRSVDEVVTVCTDPHALPPRNAFFSIAKLTSWVFLYHIKYNFHGHKNSTLLVWDRYIYDVLVDPRRYRVALPKWLLSIFVTLAPRNDLVVILDVPVEVAYARKQEVALEDLIGIRANYLKLAKNLPNAKVISTAGEPEEAVEEILELFSSVLAAQTAKRIDELFVHNNI